MRSPRIVPVLPERSPCVLDRARAIVRWPPKDDDHNYASPSFSPTPLKGVVGLWDSGVVWDSSPRAWDAQVVDEIRFTWFSPSASPSWDSSPSLFTVFALLGREKVYVPNPAYESLFLEFVECPVEPRP